MTEGSLACWRANDKFDGVKAARFKAQAGPSRDKSAAASRGGAPGMEFTAPPLKHQSNSLSVDGDEIIIAVPVN